MIASSVIAFASWLSHKKPELAGFSVGLPLVIYAGIFLDSQTAVTAANSIMVDMPIQKRDFCWLLTQPVEPRHTQARQAELPLKSFPIRDLLAVLTIANNIDNNYYYHNHVGQPHRNCLEHVKPKANQ